MSDALLVNKVSNSTIQPSISDIINTYVRVLIFPKFFFVTFANALTSAVFLFLCLMYPSLLQITFYDYFCSYGW